jgi:hypothetical protein
LKLVRRASGFEPTTPADVFYWLLTTVYSLFFVGSPAVFHACMPPTRAAVFSMPFVLSVRAAPALEFSCGQVQ